MSVSVQKQAADFLESIGVKPETVILKKANRLGFLRGLGGGAKSLPKMTATNNAYLGMGGAAGKATPGGRTFATRAANPPTPPPSAANNAYSGGAHLGLGAPAGAATQGAQSFAQKALGAPAGHAVRPIWGRVGRTLKHPATTAVGAGLGTAWYAGNKAKQQVAESLSPSGIASEWGDAFKGLMGNAGDWVKENLSEGIGQYMKDSPWASAAIGGGGTALLMYALKRLLSGGGQQQAPNPYAMYYR